jgi:hypothetical protein
VVVCNIPSFYQIFGKKIVLFVLCEKSQGIKTFCVYIKEMLQKLFQTFLCCLRNFFEKIKFQNIISHLFKHDASISLRNYFSKGFISLILLEMCLK